MKIQNIQNFKTIPTAQKTHQIYANKLNYNENTSFNGGLFSREKRELLQLSKKYKREMQALTKQIGFRNQKLFGYLVYFANCANDTKTLADKEIKNAFNLTKKGLINSFKDIELSNGNTVKFKTSTNGKKTIIESMDEYDKNQRLVKSTKYNDIFPSEIKIYDNDFESFDIIKRTNHDSYTYNKCCKKLPSKDNEIFIGSSIVVKSGKIKSYAEKITHKKGSFTYKNEICNFDNNENLISYRSGLKNTDKKELCQTEYIFNPANNSIEETNYDLERHPNGTENIGRKVKYTGFGTKILNIENGYKKYEDNSESIREKYYFSDNELTQVAINWKKQDKIYTIDKLFKYDYDSLLDEYRQDCEMDTSQTHSYKSKKTILF